jgi:hypothetical protein
MIHNQTYTAKAEIITPQVITVRGSLLIERDKDLERSLCFFFVKNTTNHLSSQLV